MNDQIKCIRYHSRTPENEGYIIWLPSFKNTLDFYETSYQNIIIPELFLLADHLCVKICYYDNKLVCLNSVECIGCPLTYEWVVQVPENHWKQGAISIKFPSSYFEEDCQIKQCVNEIISFIHHQHIDTIIESIWDCGTQILLFSETDIEKKFEIIKKQMNDLLKEKMKTDFYLYEVKFLTVNPYLILGFHSIEARSGCSQLECVPLLYEDHIKRSKPIKNRNSLIEHIYDEFFSRTYKE